MTAADRRWVIQRAGGQCEYCHLPQAGLNVQDISHPATRDHNVIRAESNRDDGRN